MGSFEGCGEVVLHDWIIDYGWWAIKECSTWNIPNYKKVPISQREDPGQRPFLVRSASFPPVVPPPTTAVPSSCFATAFPHWPLRPFVEIPLAATTKGLPTLPTSDNVCSGEESSLPEKIPENPPLQSSASYV